MANHLFEWRNKVKFSPQGRKFQDLSLIWSQLLSLTGRRLVSKFGPTKGNKEKSPFQISEKVISFKWWEQRESNPRPSACKADALNQLSYAPFLLLLSDNCVRLLSSVGHNHQVAPSFIVRLPCSRTK